MDKQQDELIEVEAALKELRRQQGIAFTEYDYDAMRLIGFKIDVQVTLKKYLRAQRALVKHEAARSNVNTIVCNGRSSANSSHSAEARAS